ncbi:unnamed protein product [Camellia sinensis]
MSIYPLVPINKPGMHVDVGVVGLGGLGHMVVKVAKAFGVKLQLLVPLLAKRRKSLNISELTHSWSAVTLTRWRL